MSIVIPELSFVSNFQNYTTSSCNTEGYSQLSYFVVSGATGSFQIKGSADGANWYTLSTITIASSGLAYTDKHNITTKFIKFSFSLISIADVACQAFFFVKGSINVYNTLGGGVSSVTATGPVVSSGGSTPNISLPKSSVSQDGYLDNDDFLIFSNKVSSVSGSAPISSSGGQNPTISLDDTAVVPGSYTLVSATVDQKGRLTSIGNGTAVTSVSAGTGISLSGGTGAVTITNIAPDQTVSLTSGTGISATGTYPNFTITNSGVTSLTSGTGISLSGGTGGVTVTNSAPDQTVALTSGTGISVTGAYPNFTITNTSTPASVKSMIITPYDTVHASTTTQYFCSFFHGGRQNAANQFYSIMPSAGTFKNMYVSTSAALGLSDTCTYTLYKSTGATALTCTLGTSDTLGSDLTHNVSCSAGDLFCWSFQNSNGNGASVRFSISCEFYPS